MAKRVTTLLEFWGNVMVRGVAVMWAASAAHAINILDAPGSIAWATPAAMLAAMFWQMGEPNRPNDADVQEDQ